MIRNLRKYTSWLLPFWCDVVGCILFCATHFKRGYLLVILFSFIYSIDENYNGDNYMHLFFKINWAYDNWKERKGNMLIKGKENFI